MDRASVVADTDALIDFVEGEGSHARIAKLLREGRLATTAITVFEIWRGCDTDDERDATRRLFRGLRVYPLTDATARRGAEVSRSLADRGTGIGERDALIAGVCLAVRLPLLTANIKHFGRVAGLQVVPAR